MTALQSARTMFPFISLLLFLFPSCGKKRPAQEAGEKVVAGQKIEILNMPEKRKVEIRIDNALFTAYNYPQDVAKPVLYPLITASGKTLTRGFPIAPRPFERTDHPHHVGYWLNYGDVNGLDFWGNSQAMPEERRPFLGTIIHREILGIDSDGEKGSLKTRSDWIAPDETVLLEEITQFVFSVEGSTRIIDRMTTLKARDKDVLFKDTKEGMLGIRVIRALELPSNDKVMLTDAEGRPGEISEVNNEGVDGHYLSSEGIKDAAVWGTRARWMELFGNLEGEPISLTIIDHPDNVGYPTYWHARGYGLFAANPFGQETFSEGRESLNFVLQAGESVTLKYRLLVHSGSVLSPDQLNAQADQFATQ